MYLHLIVSKGEAYDMSGLRFEISRSQKKDDSSDDEMPAPAAVCNTAVGSADAE
jgi:hypothetical protein